MNIKTYNEIEKYMHRCMNDSAHDIEHIYRVLYNALTIAGKQKQKINYDVLITACLLHDIGRETQNKDPSKCHAEVGSLMAEKYLINNNWQKETVEHIKNCISSHRFRGNNYPETIEAKILFDSDKLDVIGLLGIARTLLYQGNNGIALYQIKDDKIIIDKENDNETFFSEYEFKLSKLYNKFYTKEAEIIAGKYQEDAKYFVKNLSRQIINSYNNKNMLNKIL